MKKLIYLVLAAVLFAVGCSESFDDSKIWDKLDDHESRISQLEELCKQMNTNISSLQTLVEALSKNDYITNVAPISKNGEEVGYTITFKSGKTITIYHGEDGKDGQDGADGKDGINGENGADGKDGKDGSTPIIGVKKDADNIYYWTLNGEWLLDDDGNKIKAVGTDGKDGQNGADGEDGKDGQDGNDGATGPQGPQGPQGPAGEDGEDGADGKDGQNGKDGKDGATGPQGPAGENGADGEDGKDGQNGKDGKDGITPQLKIEEGYWYISYDNGSSWKQLGKATGENGKDGQDGKDGKDGANGADGKDGADGDSFFQSVTQDDEYVYFTLADGTQITLAKEQALEITFNTEECFVNGGESYEVTYTITGADADTKVAAMAQDNYTVKVVPTDYKSGKIVVTAPSADITESQVLVFVSKGTQTIMRVLYFAEKVTLTVSTDNVALEYDDTTFEVKVTTNLDYTVHIPEEASSWLSVASTRAMREETLSFAVEENTTAERRSTIIELRRNGKAVQSIAVSQGVNPEYLPAGYKIFYTSTNGKVVAPRTPSALGAAIVSNTYANGVGVIVFDRNITTIGSSAFSSCSSLTSITIPDSVTTIGGSAFYYCSSLTSITIPDSVTTIGSYAFSYCSSLTSITIPDSVTTIGVEAFCGCKRLTSITIPDSVTTIGYYAFSRCSSLATITIPDSVTTIGIYTFSDCSSLTTAVIGSGVKSIGSSAFENCIFLNEIICKPTTPPTAIFGSNATEWNAFKSIGTSAKIYVPYESVEAYRTADYWKDYANYIVAYDFDKGEIVPESRNNQIFYTATAKIEVKKAEDFGANCISNEWDSTTGEGVMTFDADVTKVGVGAFSWRTKLTSVTLPSSVKTIETYAFSNCNVLKNVNIPDGVTAIGNEAFKNCYRLEQISLPEGLKSIGEYAFNKCTDLTAVVIPNSVTSIGQCAFLDCESLTNATLGSGIKEISRCLFGGTCLHSINIPNGVTTIAREAFISCWRLTSVTIPDSVEYIGQESFASCNNMQSVTIGSGVTTIMDSAFEYCSRLKEVFCKPTTPPNLGYCVFDSNASDRKIYVPESANDVVIDAYKSAKNWDSYTDVIVEKAM